MNPCRNRNTRHEGGTMSETGDVIEAVLGLLVGGLLFVALGSTLGSSNLANSSLNFEFWGILYIAAALILGAAVVAAFIYSILNNL